MAENPNDSFLSDDAEWIEQVHRIGTGKAHALTGGIDGNLNIAVRQLAKRTRWLKEQLAAGGGMPRVVLTAAATLADNRFYLLNYAGGVFDVTLPATPAVNTLIVCQIVGGDIAALAPEARPRILRNGKPVEGVEEDIELDTNYARFVLGFAVEPARGWLVKRG